LDAEMATLKKIVFIPITPDQVPEAMVKFARRLKEIWSLVKSRILHPVPAGAWVHHKCGEIHPFNEGNGGVCRALMNIFLQLGGIKSIVIPNNHDYMVAVRNNQKLAGSFVNYLIKMIQWNTAQKSFRL